MRRGKVAVCALAWLAGSLGVAGAARAQDVSYALAVTEGGAVGGVGAITRIDNLAVNDAGDWLVEADTDHPDADADSVLIGSGELVLREGQSLPAPSGATLGSFDAITLNNSGASAWNFFLDGTSGTGDDTGIYFNTELLIQEGSESMAPEFAPGTVYRGFLETKLNDSNEILVMASMDDPTIPSTLDRALVIVSYDGAGGFTERAAYKEGDILPEQVEPIGEFETGPHDFDFNGAGQALFIAELTPSEVAAVYLDDTLLAQEGQGSPVPGRSWRSFGSAVVALGDGGDWVMRAQLDGDTGSDIVIVRGGEVVAQEGGAVPGVPGAVFTSFGSGPVGIDSEGRVYWYGAWAGGEAIFRDDAAIVVAGSTMVEGSTVTDIASVQDTLAASDSGRFVIAEVTLDGGPDAALLIEIRGECYADCDGSGGLDFFDFLCFQNAFAAGEPYADCDASGTLDFFDFLCFQNAFAMGCP